MLDGNVQKGLWLVFTLFHAGQRPLVVAKGGFSGLFPESSSMANQNALATSLSDVVLYCNLQLTKDGIGVCLSDIKLDNNTNVPDIYPKGQKTYTINGQSVRGWFALDFTIDQLFNKVTCKFNYASFVVLRFEKWRILEFN